MTEPTEPVGDWAHALDLLDQLREHLGRMAVDMGPAGPPGSTLADMHDRMLRSLEASMRYHWLAALNRAMTTSAQAVVAPDGSVRPVPPAPGLLGPCPAPPAYPPGTTRDERLRRQADALVAGMATSTVGAGQACVACGRVEKCRPCAIAMGLADDE